MANPLIAEFWTVVLPLVASEHPSWANRTPREYWIHGASGIPGFKYSLWVKRESTGCGLLIDRGAAHIKWTKSMFDALKRKGHQIEQAFGGVLDWYRLDNQNVSVVEAVVAQGGYLSPRVEWSVIGQLLAKQLYGFQRAFQPHLAGAADVGVVVPDLAEQLELSDTFAEGATTSVVINAYERNPAARRACLDHWGYRCDVCDVLLAEMYGAIADGFIHVHHLRPIAEIGREYMVDPVADLRPVCPNCHAIIHLRKPQLSIDEAKALLLAARSTSEMSPG